MSALLTAVLGGLVGGLTALGVTVAALVVTVRARMGRTRRHDRRDGRESDGGGIAQPDR